MEKDKKNEGFFDLDELSVWKKHWQDMPEFIQGDLTPHQSILVHFGSEEDRKQFAELLNQKLTSKTKFIWFPKLIKANLLKKICTDES